MRLTLRSTTPLRRPARHGLAVAAVTCLMVAVTAPALAVGTSGVDLTPALPRNDAGSYVLTLEDREPGDGPELVLTNLTAEPRSARVYAASADMRDAGGVGVGGPGTVPWLPLDESFELGPDEVRTLAVELEPRRGDLVDGEDHFVALVLEVSPSESLVTQAVTILRVEQGPVTPLPRWPVLLAVVLLVTAVLALLEFGRRRGDPHGAEGAAAPG